MTWFALSIRQPWAWAILHAGKRVENRQWPLPERMVGKRVLLHASSGMTRQEYRDGLEAIAYIAGRAFNAQVPPMDQLTRGAVVGVMTLDCCDAPVLGPEPTMRGWWATDQYGWRLSRVTELPRPVQCKGALWFWRVPSEIADRVRELARGAA